MSTHTPGASYMRSICGTFERKLESLCQSSWLRTTKTCSSTARIPTHRDAMDGGTQCMGYRISLLQSRHHQFTFGGDISTPGWT